MRSRLFIFLCLIMFVVPTCVDAQENNLYSISKYDVNIVVTQNNVLEINETINAYFKQPQHGIYRKIPLHNEVVRLDGKTSYNRAEITEVYSNKKGTADIDGSYYNIKLGSEDKVVVGEQTYTLKYKYNLGKDPISEYDELYFNIIGDEWDTTISNISFNIVMPKDFDASKLGFSSGKKGSIDNSKISYKVDNRVISGTYNGSLKAGEALTIRIELPEGYFVGAKSVKSQYLSYMYIIPVITLIIIVIWSRSNKKKEVYATVEFYPPEELNSLETSQIYFGMANFMHVSSLFLYFANRGYIKISENSIDKNDYTITKLKDYDGSKEHERMFIEGLFTNKISNNLNKLKNRNKIIESSSFYKSILAALMVLISIVATVVFPLLEYTGTIYVEVALITLLFGFYMVFLSFVFKKASLIEKIIFYGFPLFVYIGFTHDMPIWNIIRYNTNYLYAFIFCVICIILMLKFIGKISKRTEYVAKMLAKIEGFRNFLEVAEKPRLEALVRENPTYFYETLSYAYALGVSNVWMEKFESLIIEPPSWYDGTDSFSNKSFVDSIDSIISSVNSSASSGSSGGGSSGGGSGGGGGGSW